MPEKSTVRTSLTITSTSICEPSLRAGCQPRAIDLFTTTLSHLTPASPTTYPRFDPNYSPAPQISARFGDLFGLASREIPGISQHLALIYSPHDPNTR